MALTAQEVADRWEAGASAAAPRFEEGVRATDVDVVGRAIQQQGSLLRNFTESVTSGRWAKALLDAGGTAYWKTQTIAKSGNYGTGIAAGKARFQHAMQNLLPHIARGQEIIDSMPKGTLQASKNRAIAWIDHMSRYKTS